jgi:predicted nucleic acid-binding protein
VDYLATYLKTTLNMPGTNAPLLVIGDTDGLIALLHEEDGSFLRAKETVEYLALHDAKVIFTVTTILETITTFTRKLNKPELAAHVIDQLQHGNLSVEAVDEALLYEALHLFVPTASKKRTIFDACVAATAQKLRAKYIFSFDNWYTQLGYYPCS